jgi:imidazolonepropionase-like amidohydrolase
VIRASGTGRFLVLAGLALPGCAQSPPDGVALSGATLIDGTGGPPLPDAVVVVRGGHVESIGPRAGFELPKKTSQLDLTGRWIIPGLIDAHVHVAPASTWAPTRFLAWGVTTVRDVHGTLNGVLALRKRINSGAVPGPRIYTAGAMIDGLPTTYGDALGVSSENDARKAVDRLVSAGVDFIKVFTHIDPTLLRAIVDEARTFNLSVSGHLGMTDAVTAGKLGISCIEHMTGVPEAASSGRSALLTAHYRGFFPGWTAFERSWAGLDSVALTQVAQRLVEEKVSVVPTLILHETLSRLNDSRLSLDPGLADVPAGARQAWDIPDMISRAGWTDSDFVAFRRARPAQDLFLRAFAAAGGRIAAGTDTPNQLLVPGYSEHRELELLVGAGLTPREALRAATRNAAVLLGVDSLGLIAPGKVADLVILKKDPLADIRNTRSIQAIMSRGHLYNPDSLRSSW